MTLTPTTIDTVTYRSPADKANAQLGIAIAAQLGDGWTARHLGCADGEPITHSVVLDGPGVSLAVLGGTWAAKGRIEISASTPHGSTEPYSAQWPRPRITVAADRDPAAIARDVERRIVADATLYCARTAELTAARNHEQSTTDATVAQVIALTGGHARDRTVYPSAPAVYSVQVSGDRLYKVELNDITVDQYAAIAAVLADRKAAA